MLSGKLTFKILSRKIIIARGVLIQRLHINTDFVFTCVNYTAKMLLWKCAISTALLLQVANAQRTVDPDGENRRTEWRLDMLERGLHDLRIAVEGVLKNQINGPSLQTPQRNLTNKNTG